jgi:hypothetical protein
MRRPLAILPAALLSLALATPAAHAAWNPSPTVNLPVCTAGGYQYYPVMVPDGAGGAIVAWQDGRGAAFDIYAQHILASGSVDPAWPADGRLVCGATDNQQNPVIASDGAGGAIVAWLDYRNVGLTGVDVYAHHVLASGVVDPAWPADGRALCTAASTQFSPGIIADGAGGAIVAWHDARSGTNWDIYAQHVFGSGIVDPAWTADGTALCLAAGNQSNVSLAPDGFGGAIVAWTDFRTGNYQIFAQHVRAFGSVDPAWPVNGRILTSTTAANPQIIPDGSGGAIAVAQDYRSLSTWDIYAHHVLASGAMDPSWPVDGRALCTAAGDQYTPAVTADGWGGVIASWRDYRAAGVVALYAGHVQSNGVVDPAWPADGRAVCIAGGSRTNPVIATDNSSGCFIAWEDYRTGGASDLYVQHVRSDGSIDPTWPLNGRAFCTAASDQHSVAMTPDGSGAVLLAWYDTRTSAFADIYAQYVSAYGMLTSPAGTIASVRDVPIDQGGQVKLSWNASYLEGAPFNQAGSLYYYVFRSVPPQAATARLARGERVAPAVADGLRSGQLVQVPDGATTTYWEYLAYVSSLGLPGYSYIAATLGDSTAAGSPRTWFMVQTRGISGMWNSAPDSCYSVDNLAPAMPAPFAGTYAAGTATLTWRANTEADLAGYRLYRGTTAAFVPSPGNRIATLAADAANAVDVAGGPYYYRLTAVDVHGNESPSAFSMPSGTLDAGAVAPPRELALAVPSPNPAVRATTLRFAVPRAAVVTLAVFDAVGRRVRVLASGGFEAGEYARSWDLRDDAGRPQGAGLYFARLECEGRTITRRLTALR